MSPARGDRHRCLVSSVIHDLIVLGAGPAGTEAAICATELGLDVALIDEGRDAGGQVVRPPGRHIGAGDGDYMRLRLAASGAHCFFDHRAWTVEPGFAVETIGPEGSGRRFEAPALIVATGAIERVIPVPGWTLPGVFGLAAATVLLKAEGVLPGRRIVVAGSGPLLFLVAAKILADGGTVVAVIDVKRRRDWTNAALLGRPDLVLRGAIWLAKILRAGVPVLSGSAVRIVAGEERVEHVVAGLIDRCGRPIGAGRIFHADALCMGFGLLPSAEVTRLLGAAHQYLPGEGWVVVTDGGQRTSVAGLYACGAGARVLGADAAPQAGRAAALAVYADRGAAAPVTGRGLSRAARFGVAMTRIATPPPGITTMITSDTIVCRCEGITRGAIDAAAATSLSGLKAATRCGMGPCGGRMCGEAAALLIAERCGVSRATVVPWSIRPPLRPVPLATLAGAFDYATLPMPQPAPL